MSTERSKFAAGKRGVIDVNAFYGSMTVGGGEGGGIPLVVRSRVAPLWQRQQLDGKTRATRRRDQVADTSSARKVPTVGAKKRRVAASDVPPKKATATTTINIRRNNDNGDYKWHATGRTLTMNGSNGKRVATKRVARTGRGMERIVTKWLMMPQSNFGQSSVSSLEDITREAAGDQQQQHLNLESKPKSILVNSRVSQLLLDEQPQAQLKPLLTKRQQQSLQQSLLLQADSVESMTFVDNSKLAASSAKPSPNSSSNTTSNWHSKSSSNSTYQTTLGICCSSSGSWGHEQPILPQTAGNRGLKITATVIKIMPDLPPTKAITNLPGSGGVTAATVVPTTVTTLPVVTPATVAASKPQKRILHKPKQTQRAERLPPIKLKQPPAIAAAAAKGTIATATPRATAATAATATVAAKIVRVAQHKIPSTIEDGIDVSYQYFVSKPLARGKKPLPIRYLYRPMMRRLNNTTTAATRHGRRSKKGTSKTDTEPTEADQPPVLSQSSTDVESDSDSEQQQEQRQQQSEAQQQQQQAQPQELQKKLLFDGEDFKPPPLLVDPKYLPFVKQLKHHPMPKETRAQQQYNIQLQRQDQQYYQQQQQKRQQLEQERWQQENLRQQHLEQQQLQQHYLQQQQLQQEQLRAQQLEQESLEQKQFTILQQMKLQLHKQQRVIHEQQQQLLAHEIQQQQQQQQQEQEQNKRPTLLDYQPNVTRLPAVGGANICFHAPIRMCAGNEAAAAATTATATTATNTETTAISSYPTTAATTAMPTTAAIETATTVPATASMAAATAASTTAMQSLIAAIRYEDIEMPSCSEKSVSFEMDNKCCCSASTISNMSPKSRSKKKKRKSKARGKKKNDK